MSTTAAETIDGNTPDARTLAASTSAGHGSFLRPGEMFGPWRLIEHLADGGFGSVWRATATEPVETDQRTVRVEENAAIKFFAATTDERRRAIEREVALAQRLGGQWTPEYYGADLDAIPQWAAFEFIADATLQDLVRSTGPLRGQSLEVFAEDLWDALTFFRRNGVAHRDLTPVNIHVHARTAKPRVIDWGNAGAAAGAVHTAQLPRSAGYAAPEQVEGRAIGSAADLWSWAAVVCFAATGHPPFPVEGYHERIVTCDQPLDLDGVPEGLLPALDAALRWDPADRIPEQIAASLPGRQTAVELQAAQTRETDLDEALADLHRRLQLRDEHLDELRGLIDGHENERRAAADIRRRLADAESARDSAARETTALRSQVADLEKRLDRARAAVPAARDAAVALRHAQVSALRDGLRTRGLRWRVHRSERKLVRIRRRHGQVTSHVPTIVATVVAAATAGLALANATWESWLLPPLFILPSVGGVALSRRITARTTHWRSHARAGLTATAIMLPCLSPLALPAGAIPSRSFATWVINAPFVTPPPADALDAGHGARTVDVDTDDCTRPLPADSFWDVVVVPCPQDRG